MCAPVCCVWTVIVGGGSEEGAGSPRTGVTDDCELWCGGWELNLGPKPEQAVLLTIELPLQVPPPNFNDPSSRWVMWGLGRRQISSM